MKQKIELLVPCEIIQQPANVHKSLAKIMPTHADFAPVGSQPDLLFMRSLLVSTGENKNDDVFLPDEMWKARSTPILKPVDWEHNTGRELTAAEQLQNPGKVVVDNQTIGVMYNAYTVDENNTRISESVATAADFVIPEKFHIIDEAVIWKALYPTTAKRIEEGAAQGTLFVSMEAWFTDYHYLVGNKVIARNEETAFLDNSLKANGGTGVYGNSRVRRALRNITFGGKGIVARPANEPSVITHVSHEPISATASMEKAIANNIIGDISMRVEAPEPRKDSVMSDTQKNKDVHLELFTEAKEENANLKAEAKKAQDELDSTKATVADLQGQLDAVKAAFTKGAELLEPQLPGFVSRVTEGNPENFFATLSELLEENSKVKADVEQKLADALAKIAQSELDARTAAREVKIDSLLGVATMHGDKEMDDEKKKKMMEKKKKMMAAVQDLADEQFDALYEVWAEQQAEANEMQRGSMPVQSGSDMGRGAATGMPKKAASSEVSLEDTIREVIARMVANPNKGTTSLGKGDKAGDVANPNDGTTQMGSGAGEALNTLKSELAKRGHSVSSVDAVFEALAGHQEPSDEENVMAILDSVKASEQAPSAGEEAPQGIDLRQSFSGLVNSMLGRTQENQDK